MPIYAFRCERCGAEFEELVAVGTSVASCRHCGFDPARRVLSAQAPPFSMVKSRGDARKQERRNAKLRHDKGRFKEARQWARARDSGGRQ